MKQIWIMLILFIFSACAPSPQAIRQAAASTLAAWPTQTPLPTYTSCPPLPTYTAAPPLIVTELVTQVVIVTPTDPPTPIGPPTETVDPLYAPKNPGFYLVNVDIAPGVWRSQGTGDDCYWSMNTQNGDIIDNHFGMAGGTMYISQSVFEVRMDDGCGQWLYLGPP